MQELSCAELNTDHCNVRLDLSAELSGQAEMECGVGATFHAESKNDVMFSARF